MIRSVKVKLEITSAKRQKLLAVHIRFTSMVNAYLKAFYNKPASLNKETKDLVKCGHLPDRYRSLALQQALSIKSACKARMKNKKHKIPHFQGSTSLANGVAAIYPSENSKFDYWIKFTTLQKRRPILVPFKSHKVLNKYLSMGGKIKSGLRLTSDCKYVILSVEVQDGNFTQDGKDIGFDIGYNKMLADSDGKFYGFELKKLCETVRVRKNGSKGKMRARISRNNYIGQICNQINWKNYKSISIEKLTKVKYGKKLRRDKDFRKKMAAWTYPLVKQRLMEKAQMNRVRCVVVNPAFTSTTCPKCDYVARNNRSNELFKCRKCNYVADADYVGALNILKRGVGSLQSPTIFVKK